MSQLLRLRRHRCFTAWSLGLLALSCVLSGSCLRRPVLRVLVWENEIDRVAIKQFEQQHRCQVEIGYFSSSDDLLAKLRDPSITYDLIAPSSDVATTIAVTGLAAPLDLSRIPTYRQLSEGLQHQRMVTWRGQTYGVPYVWGSMVLLYDTTVFAEPPDSWEIFWDPKVRGKVTVWDDISTVYMAAQVLGYHRDDPAILYNLNDAQLDQVRGKLLRLKPQLRKLWTSAAELTRLMESREVVLALGWADMTSRLRKANLPIAETVPKQNATGWIDHLMIPARSRHPDLAYALIELLIQPQVQKRVSESCGSSPANPKAAELMNDEQRKSLHLDDPDGYQKRIYFWDDVPRRQRYLEIWNQVKSAPAEAAAEVAAAVAPTISAVAPAAGSSGTVTMLYGGAKKAWLEAAALEFRAAHPEIRVQLVDAGSVDAARALLDGRVQATVFSPADSQVLKLVDLEWRKRHSSELVAQGGADVPEPLVLTPLVYVAWQDRADVLLRAGHGTWSWLNVHRIAAAPVGWSSLGGQADWGELKLGMGDPGRTTAGWEALLAMGLDFHHKISLTIDDIADGGFRDWLAPLQAHAQEQGVPMGGLMTDVLRFGPSKYDLAVVYESEALMELAYGASRWGRPLRLIYPSHTVWSDNPAAVLQADWVTEADRQGARVWISHLRSRAMQERAIAFGFRPADPAIPLLPTAGAEPHGQAASPLVRLAPLGARIDLPPVVRGLDSEVVRALIRLGTRPQREATAN